MRNSDQLAILRMLAQSILPTQGSFRIHLVTPIGHITITIETTQSIFHRRPSLVCMVELTPLPTPVAEPENTPNEPDLTETPNRGNILHRMLDNDATNETGE